MDTDPDIKHFRTRWKAVEEVERRELRAMSIEKHWEQIINLARFAIENGLMCGNDDGEMDVFFAMGQIEGGGMMVYKNIGSFQAAIEAAQRLIKEF